jgi:hypothetical protein
MKQITFGSLEIGATFTFPSTGVAGTKTSEGAAKLVGGNFAMTVPVAPHEVVNVVDESYYGTPEHEQELVEWEADMDRRDAWYEGDARRCPRHPHVKTSSDDGMFDGLCGECEAEMDDSRYDQIVQPGTREIRDRAERKAFMLALGSEGWKVKAVGIVIVWERK